MRFFVAQVSSSARVVPLVTSLVLAVALGCESKDSKGGAVAPLTTRAAPEAAKADATPALPAASPLTAPAVSAAVGKPAPDFKLQDLQGKSVELSAYKGKIVVLEWFNPECPFVKLAHTKGSLQTLAKERDGKNDVVWLAINSGGEGRQGYEVEKNEAAVAQFGLSHPVLLDRTGSVGHAYGATNTPHLFVIDKQGLLVYAGAIDNSPDAEGQSPTGGTLVNYVTQALDELAQGKPVSVPRTKAYGCSVKYKES